MAPALGQPFRMRVSFQVVSVLVLLLRIGRTCFYQTCWQKWGVIGFMMVRTASM